MRHRKEGRKLSRTASHRKALMSALSTALIKHKKIRTTVAKAKEARRIVEPIITRARDAFLAEKGGGATSVAARREVAKFIRDREAVKTLFAEIAEKVGTRPGGYTRVVKLGRRLGDGAEMAILELVDYNLAQESARRKARVAKSKAAQARRSAKEKEEAEAPEEETVEPKKPRRRAKKEEESGAAEEAAAPKKTRRSKKAAAPRAEEAETEEPAAEPEEGETGEEK